MLHRAGSRGLDVPFERQLVEPATLQYGAKGCMDFVRQLVEPAVWCKELDVPFARAVVLTEKVKTTTTTTTTTTVAGLVSFPAVIFSCSNHNPNHNPKP